jgi:hypothetical protein
MMLAADIILYAPPLLGVDGREIEEENGSRGIYFLGI